MQVPTQPLYVSQGGETILKEITFKAPFDKVWAATVATASTVPWEIEFLDKDAGVIKFKQSYVYSDILGNQVYRIYHYPRKFEVEYSNMDRIVQQYVYSPTGQMPSGVQFAQETMVWRIEPLSDNETKVTIDYNITPWTYLTGFVYGVGSNGVKEKYWLDQIKSRGGFEVQTSESDTHD
jgi:hypothetical protein